MEEMRKWEAEFALLKLQERIRQKLAQQQDSGAASEAVLAAADRLEATVLSPEALLKLCGEQEPLLLEERLLCLEVYGAAGLGAGAAAGAGGVGAAALSREVRDTWRKLLQQCLPAAQDLSASTAREARRSIRQLVERVGKSLQSSSQEAGSSAVAAAKSLQRCLPHDYLAQLLQELQCSPVDWSSLPEEGGAAGAAAAEQEAEEEAVGQEDAGLAQYASPAGGWFPVLALHSAGISLQELERLYHLLLQRAGEQEAPRALREYLDVACAYLLQVLQRGDVLQRMRFMRGEAASLSLHLREAEEAVARMLREGLPQAEQAASQLQEAMFNLDRARLQFQAAAGWS